MNGASYTIAASWKELPDAGTPDTTPLDRGARPDGARPDGLLPDQADGAAGPHDEGGCGCAVGGAAAEPPYPLPLLVLVLLLVLLAPHLDENRPARADSPSSAVRPKHRAA
jgi:MYXO-CTERM domain-containing protein